MLKIYGSPLSSSGRCYWMMEELGLRYEAMPMDMGAKQHKTPEFLKINPNGKVPALVDGDLVLFESMAITNYLVDKYPSEMTPKSANERGEILQWSFWGITELQGPAVDWLIQVVFVPEGSKDLALIEKCQKKIPGILEVLNQSLTGKKFLVSERFTAADLNVASVVSILFSLKFDLTPYHEISRWMAAIQDRPAYKKFAEARSH